MTEDKERMLEKGKALKKTEHKKEVPIWLKSNLTLDEAAAYSGIGKNKLRELSDARNCRFVLWNGNKRLIKRRELDKFTDESYSI